MAPTPGGWSRDGTRPRCRRRSRASSPPASTGSSRSRRGSSRRRRSSGDGSVDDSSRGSPMPPMSTPRSTASWRRVSSIESSTMAARPSGSTMRSSLTSPTDGCSNDIAATCTTASRRSPRPSTGPATTRSTSSPAITGWVRRAWTDCHTCCEPASELPASTPTTRRSRGTNGPRRSRPVPDDQPMLRRSRPSGSSSATCSTSWVAPMTRWSATGPSPTIARTPERGPASRPCSESAATRPMRSPPSRAASPLSPRSAPTRGRCCWNGAGRARRWAG